MNTSKILSFSGIIFVAISVFAIFSFAFAETKDFSSSLQQAAARGTGAVFEIIEEEKSKAGEHAKTFVLLKQMQSSLALNIHKELLRSQNPEKIYSDIQKTLSSLDEKGTQFFNDISAYILVLDEQIVQAEQQVEDSEESFFTAIANNDAQKSNLLFEKFIQKKTELVRLRAQRGRADAIQSKLSRGTRSIRTRLSAIENNREALIAGVQFDARTARSLGLIKEASDE